MNRRRIRPSEVEQAKRFLQPTLAEELEIEHRDEGVRDAERERAEIEEDYR